MAKIFVVGLPRTGTSSIAKVFLDLGYKTAHCAYTEAAVASAEVIADTPVFAHYGVFDKQYPGSKFILLTRAKTPWLASIRGLLKAMRPGLLGDKPLFEPLVKQCFEEVFSPLNATNLASDTHLYRCYVQHKDKVQTYFRNRESDLLVLDISDTAFYAKLARFLKIDIETNKTLPHLNQSGKITDWKHIDHHLKINAKLKTLRR